MSIEGPGLEVLIAAFCLVLGASFSGLGAALASLGEVKLRALRDGGGAIAPTADRAIRDFEKIEARLLLGRVLCLCSASAMIARTVYASEGTTASILAAIVTAIGYSVLAEIGARLADLHPVRVFALLRWLRPFELLIVPLAAPIAMIGRVLERMFPARPDEHSDRIAHLAVEEAIEQGEETGSIAEEQAELMRSVLEFEETVVKDVMVPRTQVAAIEISTPLPEVLAKIGAEGHSRFPVYRERVDRIVGILYAKDLFRVLGDPTQKDAVELAKIIRKPVFFAADNQKIGSLLRDMQARRVHLAIVVDEFGGTAGIVTLEDILEEIVGDIRDEHDDEPLPVKKLDENRYIADGGVSVYDLEDYLGLPVGNDEVRSASLGGLVVQLAGRVPAPGESVIAENFELIVRDSDERRVAKVEIVRREPIAASGEEAAAE